MFIMNDKISCRFLKEKQRISSILKQDTIKEASCKPTQEKQFRGFNGTDLTGVLFAALNGI